jgi:hypothetical protein
VFPVAAGFAMPCYVELSRLRVGSGLVLGGEAVREAQASGQLLFPAYNNQHFSLAAFLRANNSFGFLFLYLLSFIVQLEEQSPIELESASLRKGTSVGAASKHHGMN